MLNGRERILVIGLDGLPYSLAKELCQKKIFPHLKSIIDSPCCRPIQAEIPSLSPVNWTSFYTGQGPEVHGVFGFTNIVPKDYGLYITDFSHVKIPTIFDQLGQKGFVSKVINLPNTYPARPIKGMLISGFVAQDLKKAVFPPPLFGILKNKGYKLEADTIRGAKDPGLLLRELRQTLSARLMALELLWQDLAWDLFVIVFTETDRLFHFLFPALTDENHPLHSECMEFMHDLDKAVGQVLERFDRLPEPKRLIMLADHGFTKLKTEVDLNAWLASAGFLKFDHKPGHELDASTISAGCQAFALDAGRIYLHKKDLFFKGQVTHMDAPKIIHEIKAGLMSLSYAGERVIERILTKNELYPDTKHPLAPDLICLPNPGFDLKGKFDRQEIFGHFGRFGCHTVQDTFFFDSQGFSPVRLRQIGQEILAHFSSNLVIHKS
ncbi:alkaline phosphatase family protein [Desulfovulcanus sp.]